MPLRCSDPLQAAFEEDLDAWLVWVYSVRAEQDCMRRLVRTYSLGWLAVSVTTLAIPWLGLSAVVASAALLFGTLLLAFELTLRAAELTDDLLGPALASLGDHRDWPVFRIEERARLIRIMNLSRLATRPDSRTLLRDELREALSQAPLANWPALRGLEEALSGGPFR